MAKKLSSVISSSTPYSKATFKMKTRSDGRSVVPGNPKPTTENDKKIHLGHIIGSGQYNLDHDHDHTVELAYDYKRLKKEEPKEATKLQQQTLGILGPIFKSMNIKMEKA